MKRVAINALVLNKHSGGLGRYITHLLKYFLDREVGFEPVVYVAENYDGCAGDILAHPAVRTVPAPADNPIKRIIMEPLVWPHILVRDKIDLFFSPHSYIPSGVKIPAVVTIHDLGFYHNPQQYTFLRVNYLRHKIKQSARRAKKIIAISEFTRRDLIETLHLSPDKIEVIYQGLDREHFTRACNDAEKERIRARYHLPAQYILSVGHLEPRKNYVRLIQAFARLKNAYHLPHSLVIVGQENWQFQEIYRQVQECNLQSSVIFTKFIDTEDLPAVYAMASIFVTASTFEGFGYTPLESMVCGTPVAAANKSSLPEITGDAAVLFDPYNVQDIADKIYRLAVDQLLQKQLTTKGFENSERFDWQRCCAQTAGLLAKESNKL
ncbi:MAG TPA: glycosyltransferase family 1 protein [bacterium]|nr:glycosyltransferase family 1 protein [bacterium]HPN45222.1 glycosyltransferase family 1 protein [bacterium]